MTCQFALKFQREGRSESLYATSFGICRSIKAQRIRSGDFLFKAQASVSHKIEALNDPVSVRRDKEFAFSTRSQLFHIRTTRVSPSPHLSHIRTARVSPSSHLFLIRTTLSHPILTCLKKY